MSERSEAVRTIGEDPRHQRWKWHAALAGWSLLVAVVATALLGLLGNGVLSESEAVSADGRLAVSYDRFVRNQGQSELVIAVPAPDPEQRQVEVRITQSYLAANQVQATTPEPASVRSSGADLVYEFPTDRTGLLLRFDLKPSGGMGTRTATITAANTTPVTLHQFVLP
ncbi:hypothetical protein ABT324_10790 [Saccharopolyspora sp. NPDC000359]|uniref:hypothetical protein n=1 Tax=Saccharopolyspora sp. NPDC000359 TaxID=3154251 RepID=UPI0033305D45